MVYEVKSLLVFLAFAIICSILQIILIKKGKDDLATGLAFIISLLAIVYIGFITNILSSAILIIALLCLELYYISVDILEKDYIPIISRCFWDKVIVW